MYKCNIPFETKSRAVTKTTRSGSNKSYLILNVHSKADVGVKKLLTPLIPDCSALRALAILKAFVIRSFFFENGYFSCLAGPKVKISPASKLASNF